MHNGMLRFAGEKMSKSLGQRRHAARTCSTSGGARRCLLFFLTGHWRKPIDFSDETMAAAPRAGRGVPRRVPRRRRSRPRRATWERFERRARRRLQHARRRSRVMHDWRDHDAAAARARDLRARRRSPSGGGAAPEVVRLAERARRGARSAGDLAEADRLRDEIEAAGWEVRDVASRAAFALVRRA